ncbi:hypothetical protein [Burkholderia aenigmatica]|uniref:hypothetical protein n=1 Tax=Burkholderia aenigmatica TaxID=2015348 RepID=UPI0015820EC0|nr:hypothetical protein [Burkholderia aenigmatica]
MRRWLVALFKYRSKYALEPCFYTSVMSATPLGFAISAHYDARSKSTALQDDRFVWPIGADSNSRLRKEIRD